VARKQRLVALPPPQPQLLQRFKDWFHNSETILLARIETFTGFLVAAIGGMDWSQIYSLDFSHAIASKQNLTIGSVAFLHGLVIEAARRRPGSTDPV
jgi:hypothetical protein